MDAFFIVETYTGALESQVAKKVMPTSKMTDALTAIWRRVFDIEDIHLNDDFFLLGGNSLTALRIVQQVNEEFNTCLSLSELFEFSSITRLASHLNDITKSVFSSLSLDAEELSQQESFSLTAMQRQLYFLCQQVSKAQMAYQVPLCFDVRGKLDLSALQRSLEHVVRQHPIYRIGFRQNTSSVYQYLTDALIDVRLQVRAVTRSNWRQKLVEVCRDVMNLAAPPLLKVVVFSLGEAHHLVLILHHHLITDAWSMSLFMDALREHYNGSLLGECSSPIDGQKLPYFYAVEQQQRYLSSDHYELDKQFWLKQLTGALESTFPADMNRPLKKSFSGRRQYHSFDQSFVDQLTAFNKQHNTTSFMVMAATLSLLLCRYNSQQEASIGFPFAQRTDHRFNNTMGLFLNTLVLRSVLKEDDDLLSFLMRVKQTCLAAYAHGDFPFDRLVSALNLPRSLNKNPCFQVMLVWQDTLDLLPWSAGDTQWTPQLVDTGTSKFDVTIECHAAQDGMMMTVEYDTDLYSDATITQVFQLIKKTLSCLLTNPNQAAASYRLITESAAYRSLERLPHYTTLSAIHHYVEKQASDKTEHIALWTHNGVLTYGQLNCQANQLAHYLRRHFAHLLVLPKERRVIGVYLARHQHLLVSILAILKMGAAYVPIDISWPTKRIEFVLKNSSCSLLLTEKVLTSSLSLPLQSVECLVLDESPAQFYDLPVTNPPCCVDPEDWCYIIYTSGTTGFPKGVPQTHRNVMRLFDATNDHFSFNQEDVWVLFHSIAFDFSVWEIWGAWRFGGKLVVPSFEQTRDPALFYALVEEHRITVLNQTPSAFQSFLLEDQRQISAVAAASGSSASSPSLRSLRYIIFGGEPLMMKDLSAWWQAHPAEQVQLVNMYGTTETTVHATMNRLSPTVLARREQSNIGVPLPDQCALVVDHLMQPLPPGIPGELLLSGAGLFAGYLGLFELTQEKLIPLSTLFPTMKKHRLAHAYRTGDLVRCLPDGSFEYLGRIDRQLKVHGFRIEAGEIEQQIKQHLGIDQCLVKLFEEQGNVYLVAYCTLTSSNAIAKSDNADVHLTNQLKNHLAQVLPEYMLPHHVIWLERFPLTANMKIDEQALPTPTAFSTHLSLATPCHESTVLTHPQRLLQEMWCDLLKKPAMGIDASFFSLGGDSMLSVMLVNSARKKRFSFSVSDVFNLQTIRELAQHYQPHTQSNTEVEAILPVFDKDEQSIFPVNNIAAIYPLTPLQLGMIYHSNKDAEAGIYLDIFSYHITMDYQPQRFKEALTVLVKRHPVLRTAYLLDGFNEPVQVVLNTIALPVTEEDYRHLSKQTQQAGIKAWSEVQQRKPFNYHQAPLFRINVLLLDEQSIALNIAFHHSILDGWSVATWVTRLLTVYQELMRGETPSECVDWNFKHYVAHERSNVALTATQLFWQTELSTVTTSDLPATPPERLPLVRFCRSIQYLPYKTVQTLSELATSLTVSLDAVMLAAYLKTLSLFSGQSEVTSGVVFNGRPALPDIEETLGLFLNTLPFQFSLSDTCHPTWAALIAAVFKKKQTLYPHRQYPLARILADKAVGSLFDNIFYFTHFHVYEAVHETTDCRIQSQTVIEQTNFSWALHCGPVLGEADWALTLSYDAHRYDEKFVAQWLHCYTHLLSHIARDPMSDHQVYIPSDGECDQLKRWNATKTNDEPNPLPLLIPKVSARYPERVAVVGEDGVYTYQQLDRLSSQLAVRLLDYRHQQTSSWLIGLCVERSAFAIVAVLAIFKAGGVYVPLDPSYPKARIQWMLENTQSGLLLTEQAILDQWHWSPTIPTVLLSSLHPHKKKNTKDDFSDVLPLVKSRDVAYVIHTSGSSGVPKGVMVSHGSLSNVLSAIAVEIQATADEKLLALTAFSFDISLLEMFLPLTIGACCVIADQGASKDPSWIKSALTNHAITVLQATPTTWALLVEHQVLAPNSDRPLKVLCGGEALSNTLANKLLALTPFVWNVYGPTETTIWSTICLLSSGGHRQPAIGRPIANTQGYVLDAEQRPLPLGALGELYIAGKGLANGYIGQAALTRERFVKSGSDEMLYRTGDLARWLAEGCLSYHGRCDHQIKVRGFRIEPLEIELALKQHPLVSACVVLLKQRDNDECLLIAFMVKQTPETKLSIKTMRQWLSARLPYYLLPDCYTFIDQLPTTAHGKLDRQALLTMRTSRMDEPYEPVTNTATLATVTAQLGTARQAEVQRLAAIWQSVLQLKQIFPDDDFFDLGGQSILALRLIAKINQVFSANLSVKDLIEHSVFVDLLAYLLAEPHARSASEKRYFPYEGQAIVDPVIVLKRARKKGSKPAIFLVHPVGGNVFYYLPFVKKLPDDQPVYAIQDPGLSSRTMLFPTLSKMAAFYLRVIKHYQPLGPYYLAGSSFGSNAVVEMTRQLLDAGESVAFVGLIDGWPYYPKEANENKEWFCQNLLTQLKQMHRFFSGNDVPELFLELHWHRQQLLVNHRLPNLSEVTLTLFKALETMPVLKSLESPYNNWESACHTTPNVFEVPGDHFTLHFPPHHEALARAFTLALRNVSIPTAGLTFV